MSERNKNGKGKHRVLFIYGQWIKNYDGGLEHIEMDYTVWLYELGISSDALVIYSNPTEKFRSVFSRYCGSIYELGVQRNINKFVKLICIFCKVYSFLRRHQYKIVHINSGVASFVFPILLAAFLNKVIVRLAHSHGTDISKNKFPLHPKKCFRFFNSLLATDYFTCSKAASFTLFSKFLINKGRVIQINNGVDTQQFCFNLTQRRVIRKSLGIEDKFVIGHVGAIYQTKNHSFLLDVFAALREHCDNAFLLLCGDGELKEEMQKKAQILGISSYVSFLGYRSDISSIMNAFDIFLLPSLHEGLPIVAVEAQATGLPCILSDTITQEVKLIDIVSFLPLSESMNLWVEKILEYKDTVVRRDRTKDIQNLNYDQESVKHQLQSFYRQKLTLLQGEIQ